MPLLNQPTGPAVQDPSTQDPTSPDEEGGVGSSELTVTAEAVGTEVMKQMDANQKSALKKVVNAGMKVLFGSDTSKELFDSIRPEDDVSLGTEIGSGATNLMLKMFNKSKGTMPGDVMAPAGAILIAKAMEFVVESNIAPATDEDYQEAYEVFTTNLQDQMDPDFRAKNGLTPVGGEQPQEAAVPEAIQGGQPPAPAPQGLLNQGVPQ